MNKNTILLIIAVAAGIFNVMQLVFLLIGKNIINISELSNITAIIFVFYFLWWEYHYGKN